MIFLRIRRGCLTLSRLVGMGRVLEKIWNGQSTISENCVFFEKCLSFPHAFMFHLPSCFGKKGRHFVDGSWIHSFIHFIQARKFMQKTSRSFILHDFIFMSYQFCFLHDFPICQLFSGMCIPRNGVLHYELKKKQEYLDSMIVSVDLARAMLISS